MHPVLPPSDRLRQSGLHPSTELAPNTPRSRQRHVKRQFTLSDAASFPEATELRDGTQPVQIDPACDGIQYLQTVGFLFLTVPDGTAIKDLIPQGDDLVLLREGGTAVVLPDGMVESQFVQTSGCTLPLQVFRDITHQNSPDTSPQNRTPVDPNTHLTELNCSLRAPDRSIETGGVQAGNSLSGLGKTPSMRYTEFSFEIPRANRVGIDESEEDPQGVSTLMQAKAVETETDQPERLQATGACR